VKRDRMAEIAVFRYDIASSTRRFRAFAAFGGES
jgi:hypothetical protein